MRNPQRHGRPNVRSLNKHIAMHGCSYPKIVLSLASQTGILKIKIQTICIRYFESHLQIIFDESKIWCCLNPFHGDLGLIKETDGAETTWHYFHWQSSDFSSWSQFLLPILFQNVCHSNFIIILSQPSLILIVINLMLYMLVYFL